MSQVQRALLFIVVASRDLQNVASMTTTLLEKNRIMCVWRD